MQDPSPLLPQERPDQPREHASSPVQSECFSRQDWFALAGLPLFVLTLGVWIFAQWAIRYANSLPAQFDNTVWPPRRLFSLADVLWGFYSVSVWGIPLLFLAGIIVSALGWSSQRYPEAARIGIILSSTFLVLYLLFLWLFALAFSGG
ncbi:MAG: hypothetical protein J2P37_06560 [Ktedonobacteraceae bacterium]|nr:hypothetical protein [Ktedonobacteraceae bacterium]MBO0789641.1 hypothetical protein [Ktedonobacteraceae bacterium]